MPSNKGNDSDKDKIHQHNPAANQSPDGEAEEYDLYALRKESSPNKNMDTSSSTSQITPECGKKDEKMEYAISCSCCSCIPVLQLNIPKVTIPATEEKTKSARRSKKNGKENSNQTPIVQYNTPAKRKAPPKGPFPYAKRKFFKSGGLLERYEAQTTSKFTREDDSEEDDDYHSASSSYDIYSDDADTSDSDEFTFPRRKEPFGSGSKASYVPSQ